jgi:hypothetical protein
VKRLLLGFISLIVLGLGIAAVLNTPYDPPAWTSDQVRRRVDALNEAAAVKTPHHKFAGDEVRQRHTALLDKVERGIELTPAESADYRVVYQGILKEEQRSLKLFDWDLTVLTDVGMRQPNNVGGQGIEGAHDHHDVSSRENFAGLKSNIEAIQTASGLFASPSRVVNAAAAYKALSDIVFHLGTVPQTKSVSYVAPEGSSTDPLTELFEAYLDLFKKAQFEPVNSPDYVRNVHAGLERYDRLVLDVQDEIYRRLGPWERTLAGRWGSWQSLSIPVKVDTIRFLRAGGEARGPANAPQMVSAPR